MFELVRQTIRSASPEQLGIAPWLRLHLSKHVSAMLAFMQNVLDNCGTRQAGSVGERLLAERLHDELSHTCTSCQQERFSCHPGAFLGAIRVAVGCAAISTLLLCWRAYWAGFLLALLSSTCVIAELFFYLRFVDWLFPTRQSTNVVARIAPLGELRARVYVSAHMDAAYEFTIWRIAGSKSTWIMCMGVGFTFLLILANALFGTVSENTMHRYWLDRILVALLAVSAPAAGWCWFFYDPSRVVPGAMDDLSGVAIMRQLPRILGPASERGTTLEHTEVVLVATGSEEAGLRGAENFVTLHRSELTQIPTYGIFLDGICSSQHVSIVDRERFLGTRYDASLIARAAELARELGFEAPIVEIPIGATDGSVFAAAGVRSIALIGLDATTLADNYHTRKDTLERIEPQALERVLGLVTLLVVGLDEEARRATDLRHSAPRPMRETALRGGSPRSDPLGGRWRPVS